jgi:hypothetical protein
MMMMNTRTLNGTKASYKEARNHDGFVGYILRGGKTIWTHWDSDGYHSEDYNLAISLNGDSMQTRFSRLPERSRRDIENAMMTGNTFLAHELFYSYERERTVKNLMWVAITLAAIWAVILTGAYYAI